ncbi:MAG TPA: Uma2 family endonuclease, partial [Chroococcidiopsis sp.]
MVTQLPASIQDDVIYPDSDGKPMADNTKQFRWIVVIEQNLDWLFADDPNVFVAGDLLWYPVQGRNTIVTAPDVLVVFGRPKGDRGSYQQWREDNIPPQVVFEILSPGNTPREMGRKLLFYDHHGVEEYYIYDPDSDALEGWLRTDGVLDALETLDDWISPRLGIRFDRSGDELQIFRPDGQRFLSYIEIGDLLNQTRQQAEAERERAESERERAEQAEQQLWA